jgi:predicted  nucleic acid-binding Zn-ribbon protein
MNTLLICPLSSDDESTKSLFNEYNQRQETLGQELDTAKKEWLKEQENKQREIKIRNDNYTKNKQREKDISDREKEYAIAKQKVEEFEAKLETEIKKAKEEGKGIGNYQAKIKTDLRQKEIEGETQNYQLRIQALESTILSNENRLNNLTQQLVEHQFCFEGLKKS